MKKTYVGCLSFTKAELGGKATLSLKDCGLSFNGSAAALREVAASPDMVKLLAGLPGSPSTLEGLVTKPALESLGFLTGADGNSYFPDLTASDLQPKPEDFVVVPFRLLSATVVAGGTWRATDFGNEAVLRASVEKLAKKPVYYNHNTDPLDWVGLVNSTSWDSARTASDGSKIPAGINGQLAIDAKTNPKLARGVLAGAIYSNSVTVLFGWEPSHEFADEYSFMDAVGTIAKDGRMVCRVVTEIYDYHESSLCYLGADPFAKRVEDNGDLHNVDTTSVVSYSKLAPAVKELYEKEHKYEGLGWLSKAASVSLAKQDFSSNHNPPTTLMPPEIFALLLTMLGLPANTTQASLTKEQISRLGLALPDTQVAVEKTALTSLQAAETERNTLKPQVEELNGKVTTLEGEKTTLQGKVTELEPLAKIGTDYTEAKRAEVVRLYNVATDNKPDAAVLELFKNAKPDALEGLLGQYTKGAKMKFSGRCKKCQSDEFEFRSTFADGDDKDKNQPAPSIVSLQDLRDRYESTSLQPARS